jgi:hypothetical protein
MKKVMIVGNFKYLVAINIIAVLLGYCALAVSTC